MQNIKGPIPPACWIDGVELNRQYPDTFSLPSARLRSNAAVGDLIKIGIESDERGGERFWVEIIARIDDGRYIGRVDNDLEEGWGITYNDYVMFEPKHVLATR